MEFLNVEQFRGHFPQMVDGLPFKPVTILYYGDAELHQSMIMWAQSGHIGQYRVSASLNIIFFESKEDAMVFILSVDYPVVGEP